MSTQTIPHFLADGQRAVCEECGIDQIGQGAGQKSGIFSVGGQDLCPICLLGRHWREYGGDMHGHLIPSTASQATLSLAWYLLFTAKTYHPDALKSDIIASVRQLLNEVSLAGNELTAIQLPEIAPYLEADIFLFSSGWVDKGSGSLNGVNLNNPGKYYDAQKMIPLPDFFSNRLRYLPAVGSVAAPGSRARLIDDFALLGCRADDFIRATGYWQALKTAEKNMQKLDPLCAFLTPATHHFRNFQENISIGG